MDKDIKRALIIAADALDICNDWNMPAVEVDPPREWNLGGGGENPHEGWCSTSELAAKLRELAGKLP